MKKTVICNLTMQDNVLPISSISEDSVLKQCSDAVVYPVNSFLSNTISCSDDIKILLIEKQDPDCKFKKSEEQYTQEFHAYCDGKYNTCEIGVIPVPFDENADTHTSILKSIVDSIEPGSELICDITFGSKDLPIVVFAALSFAMKHLNCTADYVLYRQVYFREHIPMDPVLFNMSPLLHLTSLIYTLNCDDSEKAKKMLDTLLDI